MTKIVTGKTKLYSTIGTYEEFERKYLPTYNEDGSTLKDWKDIPPDTDIGKIWTIVEGDTGKLYVMPGKHFVNRTGYYIVCDNIRGSGHHRDYRYE